MAEVSTSPAPDAQLFRDAFDASPIGIAVENLDGQPLFVNPAFCRFLGFTEQELRSKHCVDFSPPEDAEKDWALFQQLKAGSIDHYQLEKRYFRKDGSLVWGSLSISLLKGRSSPLVLAMVEDITEKKVAEETRFRHAAVIESSEDAIASGNLDGIIVTWNAAAEKMYGYTEAEVVGKPITMLVPPELPDEENKILETLRAGGSIEHFETIRVTKTGKRINISLTISPIKDSGGKIVGISGIARDITERKQAEKALQASEERLRLAQQGARIGTFDLNLRTGVDIWQPETEALYGLPPGGFGRTLTAFEDLIHPDDRERVRGLTQEMMRTGQTTEGEWRVIWPDGSVHWIAARCQVLTDASGVPSRVVGVNMDVTERKHAEQALRANEELLKIFVKNVPATVAMLDRDMRYLQVSDRWCTDYFAGREQVLGRSHYELFRDMPERWKEVHRRALAGETLRADEDQWDGQDGPHWARWEVRPWKTSEGSVGGILILAEDITRRKQMEESLSSMSRKLVDAQEQERTRIARELHDDINQRLALLSVQLEASRQNPPHTAADVSILLTEVRERIDEISSDVQSISHRLHSSQLEYLGIVAATRSFCGEFSTAQNVEVNFSHDEIPRSIPRNISLCLFRILQEAVHNAVKYSKVRHFEVRLSCSERQLSLTVSDQGVGFDPESALSRGGLGLTSMKERVRLIDGTITIESKPQQGTTISVHVPIRTEHDSKKLAG